MNQSLLDQIWQRRKVRYWQDDPYCGHKSPPTLILMTKDCHKQVGEEIEELLGLFGLLPKNRQDSWAFACKCWGDRLKLFGMEVRVVHNIEGFEVY